MEAYDPRIMSACFGRRPKSSACHEGAGPPVLAEALEQRVLFTFVAHMTGASLGSLAGYSVNLYVSGGVASKWVVFWGDTQTDSTTFLAANQSGGAFAVPFTPPNHTYSSQPTYPIYATATSTTGAVSTTGFALNSNFGTTPYQQGGEVVDRPYQSTSNAPGEAMAVDSGNGDIYVATPYLQSGASSTFFAVTRYLPPSTSQIGGVKDTNAWGTSGTYVLPAFASGGVTETDTPLAIIVSGGELYVAGKSVTSTGTVWAVAAVNTGANNGHGGTDWHSAANASLPTGQANALLLDGSDGTLAVVGQHNSQMTAISLDSSAGTLNTGFGTNGVLTVNTGGYSANATSIVESCAVDSWVMGGTTNYCACITATCGCGCTCSFWGTASDFTMVEIDDDGTGQPISTFGNQGGSYPGVFRFNLGNTIGISGGAQYVPSQDGANALLSLGFGSSANNFLIPVGVSNVIGGQQRFALARFFDSSGAQPSLDTHFGNYHGPEVGPVGTAYAAVVESQFSTSDPNYNKIVAVGANNNDFLVARFTDTSTGGGVLDSTFGYLGIFQTDFGAANGSSNTNDLAVAVGLEPDTDSNGNAVGDIVVAGSTSTTSSNAQIALADYLPNNDAILS